MPRTRLLYTLLDVKTLLSKIHKVPLEQIDVFEDRPLMIEFMEEEVEIKDEDYLFQVDK